MTHLDFNTVSILFRKLEFSTYLLFPRNLIMPCSTGKKPSVAASSRATRSSAAKAGLTPVDVPETAPSTTQQSLSLPKLCIPAGKLSHSTTPTTATPTATRAPTPTRSESSNERSPQITPPPDTNFSKAEVREAFNSFRRQRPGPSDTQRTGVLEADITGSEGSESDIEILDDAEVEQPWSPLLQPDSSHRKVKRKHGISDTSRDQVSAEESPASAAIDEEKEDLEEEEEELEEELEPGTSAHRNFSLTTSNAQHFRC